MAEDRKFHTYRATLPDGRVIERRTKRIYTHIAAVLWRGRNAGAAPEWGFLGWCGRADLAQRQLRSWQGNSHYVEGRVISVDNPR